jgi:hypothetical protein
MSEAEKITIAGVERPLGLLPTPYEVRKCFAPTAVKPMDEKDWQPISSAAIYTGPKDQGSQGSCVGASGVQVMQMSIKRQIGKDVSLSIGSLYGQINGGRDAGASLGDAYVALQKVGCCTTATIADSDWRKARSSTAWKDEAANYRLDEGVLCQSVEEFLTWLQLGFIGQMGLSANSSFNPDSKGFVPGSRGSINHALVACGMLKDDKGRWWVEGVNSWGDWALNGIFYYPVDYLPKDELWVCRTTIIRL